jgi:hypothetical protein
LEDLPTVSMVAQLIAGDGAPDWLSGALERVAFPKLMFARRLEDEQPKRAEMRETLDAVVRIIDFLLAVIGGENMPVLGHLDHAGPEPMSLETVNSLGHGMRELRDRAERAGQAIRAGHQRDGGPGRSWASESASPMVHCAMLISELWVMVRGERPKPGNQLAQQAASALWRASGGTETGWASAGHPGWRRHLDAVLKYEDERLATQRLLESYRTQPW